MENGTAPSAATGAGPSNGGNQSTSANPPISASWPRPNANPDRQSAPTTTAPKPGVVQPKPQALPKRTGPSTIIVSPRQKGNPVLANIKSVPWEYGDIPADYVLGLTTCALFLSLKYHRLHPEYIYTRIKGLQGKYALRIVLVMVDIQNHEEALRELSKTSLINNVTLILCWSSQEGGRYLELFKQFEHATPTAIRQHQSPAYSDRMVDFVTTPRSINKTDAVSLVSQFGTLRTAVNARHEDVAGIAGWGEKKVERWCKAVREPFRVQRAAKRSGISREATRESVPDSRSGSASREVSGSPAPAAHATASNATLAAPSPLRRSISVSEEQPKTADADARPRSRLFEEESIDEDEAFAEAEAAMAQTSRAPVVPKPAKDSPKKRKPDDDPLNDGVMAALSKLRKGNG
ncbi:restriction endonuclease type II-like protein [Neohortaea acidophila]|uniref:Restriction endonuclease type II-like protein n=1 Tax=Neohortaea acidophila TaxID=245834 RepID=A0A6A6PX34_9PEZI|nr:restriction endonuclease type II-like protein [Neohortaea acidophila]KAF2484316.1 restriction endonuclease type II-like protein [Neohortaea acidophila]